jgi:hypothetical protein
MRSAMMTALMLLGCGGQAFAVSPDDYVQIKQLYAAYAMAQDGGDSKAVAALFAPGGTIASGKQAAQPAANAATVLANADHRWGWDRHILSSIKVDGEESHVKGGCYLLLLNSRPNPGLIGHGRTGFYVDDLVKTAAGWRFQSRVLWMDGEKGSPFTPGGKHGYR